MKFDKVKNEKKNNGIRSKWFVFFNIILISGVILVGICFVFNNNYLNNIVFNLNGLPTVEIEVGDEWHDPFVVALYEGNSIIDEVIVNDNINTSIVGKYEVAYTIKKGFCKRTLKRVIFVKEHDNNFYLSLKGKDTVYISVDSVYIEPGYNAYYNGIDLSSDVVVTGDVNSKVKGEYLIKYKIQKGNFSREKVRKVVVVNFNYQIGIKDDSNYVKDNEIIFTTSDINYDYVLMPDGKINRDKNIFYKIEENGNFEFIVYNKLGFTNKHIFEIKNIDKIKPTGTCTGYMYDTYTKLVVNANDQSGISSYHYFYGNKNSGKTNKNEYQYNDFINDANVDVFDKVDNKISIKCNMIDKSTTYLSGYNAYTFKDLLTTKKMNYWLYIPKDVTKRKTVPLLIYLHGSGSNGDDINLVNGWAYPKFIKEGNNYPFMMIAPQINSYDNWSSANTYQLIMRLVENVVENYGVNTKKIILAGGSAGASGVYAITANYPKYFSCSVVGAGVYYSGYKSYAPNLIYTPMWIFHGTNDDKVMYSGSKSFAEYINSLGGNVKFISVEGAGHDVTETTQGFKNPELIKWMLEQERK